MDGKDKRSARAELYAALEQSQAGILIADAPDVRIRLANAAALGIRGASNAPLVDIPVEQHPANWQCFHLDGTPYDPADLPLSRAVLRGETCSNVELIIRRSNGEDRTVLANAAPIHDAQGRRTAGIVVFLDITEWQHTERSLRDKLERHRAYFEGSSTGMYVYDEEGELLDVNAAACRMHGMSRERLFEVGSRGYIAPESHGLFAAFVEQLLEGDTFSAGAAGLRGDGSRFDIFVEGFLIDSGDRRYLCANTTEITDRKRAERALRESEARYRSVVEDQSEFVVRWRPDGTRTFVNEAYCRFFGQPREELIGTSFFPLIDEEDVEDVRERLRSLTPELPVSRGEHRVARPDGSVGWQRWSDRAIFDTAGRLVELQSVGIDITDRKRAEAHQRLTAEISATLLMATAEDFDERMESCLEKVGDGFSIDRVSIRWLDEARTSSRLTYKWQGPGTASLPETRDVKSFAWIRAKLERGETVRIARIADLPPEAEDLADALRALNTESCLVVPLRVGDRTQGNFILATEREACDWPDDTVNTLRVLGGILVGAMTRTWAERALEERLRFQSFAAELSSVLLKTPVDELDRTIEAALGRIAEILGLDRVTIRHIDDEQGVARLTHNWLRPGMAPLPVSADLDDYPWIAPRLSRGETVQIARLDEFPPEASAERDRYGSLGIKSFLSVPLMASGERLGVCLFSTADKEREWPDQLVRDLRGLAEIMASALIRARGSLELRARERELARAQEVAEVGSGVYDVAADQLSFSDEAMRIIGTPDRSLSLAAYFEFVHPEDRTRVRRAIEDLLANGWKFRIEYRFQRPDGSVRHVRDYARIDRHADGTAKKGLVTWLDITDRVQADQAIRRHEADLVRSQRAASVGSYSLDLATGLVDGSPVLEELIGVDNNELNYERYRELIHPEDRERIVGLFERRLAEGDVEYQNDYRIRRPDGVVRYVRDGGEIERDADGTPRRVYGAILDVTAYKDVEALMTSALDELQQLQKQLQAENVYLQEEIRRTHGFDEIVGESEGLARCLRLVEQVAATDSVVLILGETGTGKELIARALHDHGNRKQRPLVKVNCAALPASLIESELFGHERGAFTGAERLRQGRFELADGGTLFLDEIGDLPLELQGKLLRVLQEGEFQRVGGTKTLRVDVRVITATNRDLERAVEQGEFRADLFYRLNVFPIEVPPLRERKEDIPLLVGHFARKHARRVGRTIESISGRMLEWCAGQPWPGNLRELENVVERALISSEGAVLDLAGQTGPAGRVRGPEPTSLVEVERRHIETVLQATGWTIEGKRGAATMLGMPPSSLRSKMKKLRIERGGPDDLNP